jgi:hypothetical protein
VIRKGARQIFLQGMAGLLHHLEVGIVESTGDKPTDFDEVCVGVCRGAMAMHLRGA